MASAGGSKCTTQDKSSTWMPRAATSVATRARGIAVGERGQGPFTLALGAVAVNDDCVDPRLAELPCDPIGPALGATEDKRTAVLADEACREFDSIGAIGSPEEVRHCARARFVGHHIVTGRVVLIAVDDGFHFVADGGREQEHLTLGRRLVEQPTYRREKAHVGHPVGFVEDNSANVAQAEGPLVQQVLESSGAGDDDVDPAIEGSAGSAIRSAAVDRDGAILLLACEQGDLALHLGGQLTGGDEYKRTRSARRRTGGFGDHRDPERNGLARSRRGAAADVPTSQRIRDGRCLDRKWARDALLGETGDETGRDAQISKGDIHRTPVEWEAGQLEQELESGPSAKVPMNGRNNDRICIQPSRLRFFRFHPTATRPSVLASTCVRAPVTTVHERSDDRWDRSREGRSMYHNDPHVSVSPVRLIWAKCRLGDGVRADREGDSSLGLRVRSRDGPR